MSRYLVLGLTGLLGCSSGSFAVATTDDDTGITDVSYLDASDAYDAPIETNADAPPLPCEPTDTPPAKDGVFVSAATGTDFGDGSAAKPLGTITAALAVARTNKKSLVFLDIGEYDETVKMTDSDPGVVIEGGWKRVAGSDWRRNCGVKSAEQTVIKSSDAIAVRASNDGHRSGLRVLTVFTKPKGLDGAADAPGESVIGVLVSGASTVFVLDRVTVNAGAGGAGGVATSGTPPTPPTCTGVGDCQTGAAGATGSSGAPASKPGTFSESGYTPTVAGPGGPGANGLNGKLGAAGATIKCVTCPTGCMTSDKCTPATTTTSTSAPPGKCGCGGGGGAGGLGGNGGGASVGVLVVAGKLELDRLSLFAGKGGDGMYGGKGGVGGLGMVGTSGTTSFGCATACLTFGSSGCTSPAAYCYATTYLTPPPSEVGGTGGAGGAGGSGGGGAGGPSYALVLASGGTFAGVATALKFDAGGKGADGASPGASGEQLVAP